MSSCCRRTCRQALQSFANLQSGVCRLQTAVICRLADKLQTSTLQRLQTVCRICRQTCRQALHTACRPCRGCRLLVAEALSCRVLSSRSGCGMYTTYCVGRILTTCILGGCCMGNLHAYASSPCMGCAAQPTNLVALCGIWNVQRLLL